ncbi:uncharacterized protein CIMG_13200 [Coccidioides immitis RS]|uniref:Uncharacterized protein n=1 Tax=Coccidioides immitis (strain RS) TaxID=246410 RepID=A0A0D8JWW4_COCIM|nr:uncharacterized protein CIMG_13200 [Coccidioides immitis RS]KJF60768.1 hypothetical protein CIMG_13200 [Coccidioides immitis RS]
MACGLQVNLIHFTEGASGTISGGENLRIWQSVEYRQASYNVEKREGPRIIFLFPFRIDTFITTDYYHTYFRTDPVHTLFNFLQHPAMSLDIYFTGDNNVKNDLGPEVKSITIYFIEESPVEIPTGEKRILKGRSE